MRISFVRNLRISKEKFWKMSYITEYINFKAIKYVIIGGLFDKCWSYVDELFLIDFYHETLFRSFSQLIEI